MKLTLKNARRLDQVIRDKIQSILSETVGLHNVVVTTSDDLAGKLATAQSRVTDMNTTFLRLSKIRHVIRREIETKNETSGLNSIMNAEASVREMIQFLEANLRTYTNGREPLGDARIKTIETRLENMRKQSESGSSAYAADDSTTVQNIMSEKYVEEIEIEIRRLYTNLNEFKDTCAFKNSDPANSIYLDDVDVEILKKQRLL